MTTFARQALAVAALLLAAQAQAQITFYEHGDFGGRSFQTSRQVGNFQNFGFNDRASSVMVTRNRWEVCEDRAFEGRCVVLRPGRYPSLQAMGLNDRVTSVRAVNAATRVDDERYAPAPPVTGNFRRRSGERLFEADVTAVRAVVGRPEQRCWVEREEVPVERRGANVPAALAGALIGGILGHQIGGGTGRDIATVGGVAAGAALGANIGRNERGELVTTQDVQRCTAARGQDRPDYWDVTYQFRGQEHRLQMTRPPGATITVNRNGEPRA